MAVRDAVSTVEAAGARVEEISLPAVASRPRAGAAHALHLSLGVVACAAAGWLGLALGQGKPLELAIEEIGQVVEGFNTAREVVQLARQYKVELPIAEQVYRVLHENLPPPDAVNNLLAREICSETL